MNGFWYLATPYSKYEGGIEEAFLEAARQASLLIDSGIPVFSPICHSHPIAIEGGIDPLDHLVWLDVDAPMMRAAHGLIVCKMPGWLDSYGVSVEIEAFRDADKPIIYMTPGEVPNGLV